MSFTPGGRLVYSGHHKSYTFQNMEMQQGLSLRGVPLEAGGRDGLMCPCCSEVFESRNSLQRHISATHPEALPYTCNICGKGMHTKRGLELHENTHGERKFFCPLCDSKFKFKHHLKSHLLKIHGTKICPRCSGAFSSDDFNSHVLTCF
ncbi:zinc finger protein 580 [Elysia marginata]|uniref:Zinc finger protein 580 n=1 Tax=Elysia marginata TaxID=1093978 RepID=A0AAV4HJM0_9GAST|nr:zinc finger protein 580 [Elysia marginata]